MPNEEAGEGGDPGPEGRGRTGGRSRDLFQEPSLREWPGNRKLPGS
jgi:hypothetical protein